MSLLLGPPQAEPAGCSLPPRRTPFHSHLDGRSVLPCVCPPTCQFPSEILDFQMAGGIFVYLAPRLVLHSHAGAVSVTTLPFFPGKQFKCTVCDYTAAQKPQLLRHMEQHASFKVRGHAWGEGVSGLSEGRQGDLLISAGARSPSGPLSQCTWDTRATLWAPVRRVAFLCALEPKSGNSA